MTPPNNNLECVHLFTQRPVHQKVVFYLNGKEIKLRGANIMGNSIYHYVEVLENITVHVGLFNKDGKLIDDSAYDIEIFPTLEKNKKMECSGGCPQQLIK